MKRRNHLRLFCLLSGMLILCVSVSGCARFAEPNHRESLQNSRTGKIFRMNLTTEPPELDPAKVTDLTSFTVVLNLMRGLTLYGANNQLESSVASRWEQSADGKQYRFYLNPKARWSDGKRVTAQHFVDAWKRVLTPETGSEYAFFLFHLKNARAYYEGKITDFNQVGVQALGPDPQGAEQLVVTLAHPVAYFLSLLAAPVTFPIRLDLIRKAPDRFTEAGMFLANGPYQLQSWRHDEQMILTPNPFYFGKKPQVDRVVMQMIQDANTSVVMYENAELDYIETPSSIPSFDVRRLAKRADYHRGPLYALYYFGFNTEKAPFDNPKVRQAFALALDRSVFPKLLQSGQQAFSSWIPPGLAGSDPAIGLAYNPDRAKQLLAEAGYPNGKGFPVVTLSYRSLYDIQKECEIAQFLWQKNLGVSVRLQNLEWKVFLRQLREETPQIYRLNWYADYPDPDTFMSLFQAGNGNNYTHWQSQQYDHLIQSAAASTDPVFRQKRYREAQKLLLEQVTPVIPIYIGEKGYLLRPGFERFRVNALNLILLDQL